MLSLEGKFPKSSIMLYRNSEWWEAFPAKFKTILSSMPIKILVGLGVVAEATSGHYRTQRKCLKPTSKWKWASFPSILIERMVHSYIHSIVDITLKLWQTCLRKTDHIPTFYSMKDEEMLIWISFWGHRERVHEP